ncbi:FadR/GntR family transcriptional regulator [Roseovarius sp. M141]|uniref:FadR/GntR family transcriptional regulator n=1 Tax=Roseovarius sp. M141 TaxID=2583806 RepID=UPI0020CDADCF|nr:GntR family transcriptional regulator [Roseovarius sp. M141]MCQ0091099.1 FadR family transcriptional regulator [Roseovarius sp. M141]
MKIDPDKSVGLPAQIAKAIRDAIVSGDLIVDERLPSEAELATQFGVSRPTIREALKRLAAQSLIRTQRGAFGGAFVQRLSYAEARAQLITTSTLLLSMNRVSFDTACEARFALERACAPLAAARRTPEHLTLMRNEIMRQATPELTDEAFCASDVAFHRALVDGAQNPVLSYQLSGSIEAMQPLMNMITFTARSRAEIVAIHSAIITALEHRDSTNAIEQLERLETYTKQLAHTIMAAKRAAHGG